MHANIVKRQLWMMLNNVLQLSMSLQVSCEERAVVVMLGTQSGVAVEAVKGKGAVVGIGIAGAATPLWKRLRHKRNRRSRRSIVACG